MTCCCLLQESLYGGGLILPTRSQGFESLDEDIREETETNEICKPRTCSVIRQGL